MEDIGLRTSSFLSDMAAEKLGEAIKHVYHDGFEDGYSEAKKGVAVEFIDLGLESGTLWSANPLRENDGESVLYLAFDDAIDLCIPTEEQWNELRNNCTWEYSWDDDPKLRVARCIGPNGNSIEFNFTGHRFTTQSFYFWIKDGKEHFGEQRLAASICNGDTWINTEKKSFVFPVRLAIRGR